MGNGLVMPRAASAVTNGSATPRSAKVLSVVIFGVFQHQVARLPVGKIDRRDTSSAWGTNHLGMKKRFTTRWQAR
jgi:hypothetical protein